jgi:hypothetical protein
MKKISKAYKDLKKVLPDEGKLWWSFITLVV